MQPAADVTKNHKKRMSGAFWKDAVEDARKEAEAASAAATQAAHYAQEVARARGMSPRRHSSSRSLSPAANRVLDQAYNWPHVPRSARRDRSISPQAERPLQRQLFAIAHGAAVPQQSAVLRYLRWLLEKKIAGISEGLVVRHV